MEINRLFKILLIAVAVIGLLVTLFFTFTVSFSGPTAQPVMVNDKEIVTASHYRNSLQLFQDKAVLQNGSQADTLLFAEVEEALTGQKAQIRRGTFYLIVSPETPFEKVQLALDACEAAGIADYKMVQAPGPKF